jgi:hypothetical protein
MILGIVGAEAAKFTEYGQARAKLNIQYLIDRFEPTGISSGACHLGGADIWAEEAADYNGLEKFIYPPKYLTWKYYQARNIQIAEKSDIVVCLAVDKYPPDYVGMRFEYCYHCVRLNEPDHIKSGGCWTTKYARVKLGKEGRLVVINNEDPLFHTAGSAVTEEPEASG